MTEIVEGQTKSNSEPKSFEDILRIVGHFGKWQAWIYFWVLLYTTFLGPANFSMVFLQITPLHICIDGLNASEVPLKLPEYWRPSSPGACITAGGDTCTKWKYFPQDMRSTIVTQYDLVCKRRSYISHSFTAGNAGSFVAVLVVGQIQDKIGRTRTLLATQTATGVFSAALSFAPTIGWFMFCRFFLLFSLVANFPTSFVLGSELTTAKYRSRIMGLFWCPYSVGATLLPTVAYFVRDWRHLQLLVSAPLFISFFYFWLLPESPRWLLVEGRVDRAEKTLRQAAEQNGRTIPPSIDFAAVSKRLSQDNPARVNVLTLPRHRRLAATLLACSCTFYGMSWYAAKLPASAFLTVGLCAAVDIPGALSVAAVLSLVGRKTAYCGYMLVGGCALLATLVVPADLPAVTIALALVGKMCVKAAWTVIYVLTSEIYPTVLRGTGLCLTGIGATVGLTIAPYISRITDFLPDAGWLTMVIFGGMAVPAALLILVVPETKGRKMPDRLDQLTAQHFHKMSRDVTVIDLRQYDNSDK